jgi:hypothetical protein
MTLAKEQSKIKKHNQDNMFNTETMLPFSEIKNDTIILKDGWLRSILKIDGLNLDLKNFDEQQIILEQYKKFLNGLDFPIQILVRNSYLDLSNYINYMKENTSKIDNVTLKKQGDGYIKFLEDIDMQQGLIYTKSFYIIVPYYEDEKDNQQINKSWFNKFLDVLNSKDDAEKIVSRYRGFLRGRQMLDTRVNLIVEWLSAMGIGAEKIKNAEIISLLFRCHNPLIHSNQWEV